MANPANPAVEPLLPMLDNPNVRSFLDMISAAEGTTKHGYNTLFGGGKMESLADHPRMLFDFTETTGRPNKTTAAGRYQFLSNTWDEQAKKLGLPDFGERSQDLAAVNLLQERGILPDVLQGNWETAVKKSGPIWASLPSSTYPQPRQSNEFVMSRLNPNRMLATASTSDANPPMANPKNNPFEALNEEFRLRAPVQAEAQASMPTSFRKQVPVAPYAPPTIYSAAGESPDAFTELGAINTINQNLSRYPDYNNEAASKAASNFNSRYGLAEQVNAGKDFPYKNGSFYRQVKQAQVNSNAPTQTQATQSNPFAELNAEFALTPVQSQAQSQPVNAAPAKMPWSDVAYGTVTNLPASAGKYGKELYEAVTSPIETVKNIGMVGGGAIINQLPKGAQDWLMGIASDPQKMQQSVQMAQAVGGEYAKKYGTMEGFKKALATDPVSVIGDVSILLTGGGAAIAKAPGLGKAGQVTGQIGRTIDPFNLATKAVTKPFQLAEALATPSLGLSTGAGAEAIREAAKAGMAGGSKAEAFLEQMRGNAPIENVVSTARDAVAELYKNRSDAYTSGMTGATGNKAILDFAPIDAAVSKAEKIGTFNGIEIRGNAASALREIADKIQEFKAGDPAIFRTVEGFDKLKQAISDIQQSQPYGSPARKVADELYGAVKNEIVKQAPEYAKVMGDYENATALLKDIQGTLSLNKNANVDTSVRKLQSILRNNANTNYGRRVDLARELEATGVPGADTLFPQLAGQMLSSKTPRGIQGGILPASAGGAALMSGMTNPATAALIAAGALASSPRLVGEAAYYGGKTAGGVKMLSDALKNYTGNTPLDPYTLRILATKLGQQQTEEQR
jgi:muramidase (phage lysozyme)